MLNPGENASRRKGFRKDISDEAFLASLHQSLAPIETQLRDELASAGPPHPPIFIVGCQRSGSTLLYQLMAHCLDLGYISNFQARFWNAPISGARLQKIVMGEPKRSDIGLTSKHGVTAGLWSPHEFGYFWQERLNLDLDQCHCLSAEQIKEAKWSDMQADWRALGALWGQSIVFKCLLLGFHVRELASIEPNALFIHVTRDLADIIDSTLRTRKERYGSLDSWWSIRPPGIDKIAALPTPLEQVTAQVSTTNAIISDNVQHHSKRTFMIDYASLCTDPNQIVDSLIDWLAGHGVATNKLEAAAPLQVICSCSSARRMEIDAIIENLQLPWMPSA